MGKHVAFQVIDPDERYSQPVCQSLSVRQPDQQGPDEPGSIGRGNE